MQTLLVNRAVSMSEFKRNPAAVLRQAGGRPVAVLNHNRVGFYMLEPQLFEALLTEVARLQQAIPGTAATGAADVAPRKLIEDLLSQAKAADD